MDESNLMKRVILIQLSVQASENNLFAKGPSALKGKSIY